MDAITEQQSQWFAMRDLKRANAKNPAYKQLAADGFQVFTPMKTQISVRSGRRVREEIPFIRDLLFVFTTRDRLDPVVARTDTLQYRFIKGGSYCEPMTVRSADMHRFITAVSLMQQPNYVALSEITPQMYGRSVRLVCPGPMDGYEGHLVSVRGSAKKRILLEIPGLLGLIIEVASPDYLQLL